MTKARGRRRKKKKKRRTGEGGEGEELSSADGSFCPPCIIEQ
jgi:hypothetical protein